MKLLMEKATSRAFAEERLQRLEAAHGDIEFHIICLKGKKDKPPFWIVSDAKWEELKRDGKYEKVYD